MVNSKTLDEPIKKAKAWVITRTTGQFRDLFGNAVTKNLNVFGILPTGSLPVAS